MRQDKFRAQRLFNNARALMRRNVRKFHGDPKSVFYGDPVEVSADMASEAVGHQDDEESVLPTAVVADHADEVAEQRAQAWDSMSQSDRCAVTRLPVLACWNAFTVINPQIGKVAASSLDYMLLQSLNDYPFVGHTYQSGEIQGDEATVTIPVDELGTKSIPFFRFNIAASTLNARPGAQITIDITAVNAAGVEVNTAKEGRSYTFQRLNNTEAITGIYLPTVQVATRTLPFLPLVSASTTEMVIKFKGVSADEQVSVTIPGYATNELREIARMYNLPSGDIR